MWRWELRGVDRESKAAFDLMWEMFCADVSMGIKKTN